MKLLVCIANVPDTTAKISFKDNNTKFDETGVQFIMNPYDEWYALVRALELKESLGGSVTVIHVGPAANEPTIRKALAIGADDAVRINAPDKDSFYVANQIASFAKDKGYDIIFCGKETIDYNGSQIGGMIAGLLDLPFVSYATKLDFKDGVATIEREIQGGKEVVEVSGPFVVSASKGMAEARIPNMRGIMAARTKPLLVVDPFESEELTEYVKFEVPEKKKECKYIDPENPGQLWDLLHNEAKVI
ncbi:MAG: electron transfer flavoprotein subunit alpha [Vicingaceae bacterium]|nr:MAG: electron transfer flavoprotein subunit alpha [Vicingaceae bacterium]